VGVIAFASAKSSPGVTTTVTALAASWPADRDLHVVEVDPAGGDLVVRFEMPPEPGLVTLAATGRRDLSRDTYLAHTQALPSDVGADGPIRRILLAPVAADQASAALGALRGGLPKVLASLDADVLVDCGRLDPFSPAFEFAAQADLLVVVTRPILSEIHHLASRLPTINARATSLLVVGDKPYGVSDVAAVVGATPLGTIPVDDRAAQTLTLGHPHGLRVLRRSRLLRDARSVAEGLAHWLGPPPQATRPGTDLGYAPAYGDPRPPMPPAGEHPPAPPPPGADFGPQAPTPPGEHPPAPPATGPGYGEQHHEMPAVPSGEHPPPPGDGAWAMPAVPSGEYPQPPGNDPAWAMPAAGISSGEYPPPPPPPPPGGAVPPYGEQAREREPAGRGSGEREPAPQDPEPSRGVPWPSRPWTNGGGRNGRGGSAKHFRRSEGEQ
jgi:MinD-like ATPase involved in chromosome partitioning or flagellar assembly